MKLQLLAFLLPLAVQAWEITSSEGTHDGTGTIPCADATFPQGDDVTVSGLSPSEYALIFAEAECAGDIVADFQTNKTQKLGQAGQSYVVIDDNNP
ncbi:hypothetical protein AWENTII_006492 [Aspergillus wentii]